MLVEISNGEKRITLRLNKNNTHDIKQVTKFFRVICAVDLLFQLDLTNSQINKIKELLPIDYRDMNFSKCGFFSVTLFWREK